MNFDFTKISTVSKSVISGCKNIFNAGRKGNIKVLVVETYALIKLLYSYGLKDRYITIKNRKIPMVLVVVIAIFGLYFMYPSNEADDKIESVQKVANTYDDNGVRIYDLRKCDNAVCGVLENYSSDAISHIIINISFHDQTGNIVYNGGAETTDINPTTRMKLTIPSEVPFSYFKLGEIEVER